MSPRMPMEYAGLTVGQLLAKRDAIVEALENGSQTRVGISSGISHDFNALTPDQLNARLSRICLALHLAWLDENYGAAASENPYPDPNLVKQMRVTTIFE